MRARGCRLLVRIIHEMRTKTAGYGCGGNARKPGRGGNPPLVREKTKSPVKKMLTKANKSDIIAVEGSWRTAAKRKRKKTKEGRAMDCIDIVYEVAKKCKMSQAKLAEAMGLKSRQEVWRMMRRDSRMSCDQFVAAMNAMGYKVYVTGEDGAYDVGVGGRVEDKVLSLQLGQPSDLKIRTPEGEKKVDSKAELELPRHRAHVGWQSEKEDD